MLGLPSVSGCASASNEPLVAAPDAGALPKACGPEKPACAFFVLSGAPLSDVLLAPGGVAQPASTKKAKRVPRPRDNRVFIRRAIKLSSRITRKVERVACDSGGKGRQRAAQQKSAVRQSPHAAYPAATARLIFTSGATCPRQPDQTPHAAIERGKHVLARETQRAGTAA